MIEITCFKKPIKHKKMLLLKDNASHNGNNVRILKELCVPITTASSSNEITNLPSFLVANTR